MQFALYNAFILLQLKSMCACVHCGSNANAKTVIKLIFLYLFQASNMLKRYQFTRIEIAIGCTIIYGCYRRDRVQTICGNLRSRIHRSLFRFQSVNEGASRCRTHKFLPLNYRRTISASLYSCTSAHLLAYGLSP